MSHAPGPWIASRDRFHPDSIIIRRGGTDVADEFVLIAGVNLGRTDAKANASLIAAAPDLLASVTELLNCIDPERDRAEAKRARAAIDKAEGYV